MSLMYFSPSWFFGYDVVLEIFFAIISLMIGLFAYRIYKITEKKRIWLFGIAFVLIGTSYIFQSILNFFILSELNANICSSIKVMTVAQFDMMGMTAHMTFMTAGLVMLAYMTFRTEKTSALWLLQLISFAAIFTSRNEIFMFFIVSSIYILYLAIHYLHYYLIKKESKILLVFSAFVLLAIANLQFLFAVDRSLFYVIGHILEFFSYLLILINLKSVRKQ